MVAPARIELGDLRFEVPPGLVDDTPYTFRSHDGNRMLRVTYTRDEPSRGAAAQLAQEFESNLKGYADTPPRFEPVVPVRVGAYRGGRFDFRFEVDRTESFARTVVLELGERSFVEVTYFAVARDDERATADALFATLSAGAPSSGKPRRGLVRRSAGILSLELPESFEAPHVAQLSSPEGLRIYVRVPPVAEPRPSFEEVVREDTQYVGEIEGRRDERIERAQSGQLARYVVFDRAESIPSRSSVVRAELLLPSGTWVLLEGRGPHPDRAGLDQACDAVIGALLQ